METYKNLSPIKINKFSKLDAFLSSGLSWNEITKQEIEIKPHEIKSFNKMFSRYYIYFTKNNYISRLEIPKDIYESNKTLYPENYKNDTFKLAIHSGVFCYIITIISFLSSLVALFYIAHSGRYFLTSTNCDSYCAKIISHNYVYYYSFTINVVIFVILFITFQNLTKDIFKYKLMNATKPILILGSFMLIFELTNLPSHKDDPKISILTKHWKNGTLKKSNLKMIKEEIKNHSVRKIAQDKEI